MSQALRQAHRKKKKRKRERGGGQPAREKIRPDVRSPDNHPGCSRAELRKRGNPRIEERKRTVRNVFFNAVVVFRSSRTRRPPKEKGKGGKKSREEEERARGSMSGLDGSSSRVRVRGFTLRR